MNPSMDDAAKGKGCLPWTPQELEELVPDPQQRQILLGWEEYAKIYKEWRSPVLSELMPHLPRDEQLRLQNRFREEDRIRRRMDKKSPSSSTSSCSSNLLSEQYAPLRFLLYYLNILLFVARLERVRTIDPAPQGLGSLLDFFVV